MKVCHALDGERFPRGCFQFTVTYGSPVLPEMATLDPRPGDRLLGNLSTGYTCPPSCGTVSRLVPPVAMFLAGQAAEGAPTI